MDWRGVFCLQRMSGTCSAMSGVWIENYRVYPVHAPALCRPLHSRYILRSRSARVSSEALRWWVTLVTPFFFADCGAWLVGCLGRFSPKRLRGRPASRRPLRQGLWRGQCTAVRVGQVCALCLHGLHSLASLVGFLYCWMIAVLGSSWVRVFLIVCCLARSNCCRGYNQ